MTPAAQTAAEPALRVYLSSTLNDLRDERAAIENVLGTEVVLKHSYNAREDDLRTGCCDDVARCDVYIGVIGLRYGFIPEGGTSSITQIEFEEAKNKAIPRLIFIKDEAASYELSFTDARADGGMDRILKFREHLMSPASGVRPALFKTLKDLTEAVLKSLNEFRDRRREEREREAAPRQRPQTRAAKVRDEKSYESVTRLQAELVDTRDPYFEPALVHRRVVVRRPDAFLTSKEELKNASGVARNELIRLIASDSPIDAAALETKARLTIAEQTFEPAVTILDESADGKFFKVRLGFQGHVVEPGGSLSLDWEAKFPASVARNEDYWVFPNLYERPTRRVINEAVFPEKLAYFDFYRIVESGRQPAMMSGPFEDANAPGTFTYSAAHDNTADMFLMTWRWK